MWVLDGERKRIVQRNISFVPGLYKIFDEIMVNASDNKQRDPTMDTIKVEIDQVRTRVLVSVCVCLCLCVCALLCFE